MILHISHNFVIFTLLLYPPNSPHSNYNQIDFNIGTLILQLNMSMFFNISDIYTHVLISKEYRVTN